MRAGWGSGICKSGIGVVTNSRRTARPSHRAQRFDHATRALSVASATARGAIRDVQTGIVKTETAGRRFDVLRRSFQRSTTRRASPERCEASTTNRSARRSAALPVHDDTDLPRATVYLRQLAGDATAVDLP